MNGRGGGREWCVCVPRRAVRGGGCSRSARALCSTAHTRCLVVVIVLLFVKVGLEHFFGGPFYVNIRVGGFGVGLVNVYS
jgi:hypothetical protein